MNSLYQITEDYRELLAAIESGDIPEEAIADTLDAVTGELTEKVDNVACFIKSLHAETDAIKAEEAALAARRKAKESKADNLMGYLLTCMNLSGNKKLETARSVVKVALNPPAVQIEDEAQFIAWAKEHDFELLTVAAPKPNRTKIKEALKAGEDVPMCVLTRSESVRVG